MSVEQLTVPVTDASTTVPDAAERHILAERFKTKQCRNYLATGSCPYVHRCMFAHGEEDLRTYEENVRDGLFTEEAIREWRRVSRQPPHYGYLPSYEELFCCDTVCAPMEYDGATCDGGYPAPCYSEDWEGCSAAVSSVAEPELPTRYRWNPYSCATPYTPVPAEATVECRPQKQAVFEP